MLTLKLAYRNIFRQKRRSLLTGLSMTGGFVLCTFSFSMLEGSWGNAVDIFTLDHTGHIQIHRDDYHRLPKVHKTIDRPREVEEVLSRSEDIKGYAPRVFAPALAYADNQTTPVSLIGVDVALEPTTSRLLQKVQAGDYFDTVLTPDGRAKAMVGVGVANSLEIGPGDEIVLISQGADGSIANDIFTVSALVGNKTSFDRMGVYLPLNAAQQFLSMGEHVHEYALLVHDDSENEALAEQLQQAIDDVSSTYRVLPWQVIEETFYRTMQSDKQGNHFAMVIVVFLVFIGVLNTVLMSILERTREFGVIRALGSRPFEVVRLVFVETMVMATLSIVAGLVILVPVLAWLVNVGFSMPEPIDVGGVAFEEMTGRISMMVVMIPAALIYLFAALVSIPPGIRAARIAPHIALGSH